ncbi:Non metastatic cells 7 protein expressed [Fasciolopsis buskii]|uniref:Non metastatic cells 7 protein expressed n=1 Tax=Fasciolopsis buskii TaxID=27845 RepID=A0A8E0VQA3_9TREM|nr:Non metastatic cells 7 protein expressed [Fasciolopsis buski]
MVKTYRLVYHSGNNTVEMHDEKNNRMFLKPTKVDGLRLNDLYLGSSVTILSRTLRIVDFGDLSTKKALDGKSERCVVFIRPNAVCKSGKVITKLEEQGFRIVNLKMVCLTSDEVTKLFNQENSYTKAPLILTELPQKIIVALELMCSNACSYICDLVGGKERGDEDLISNSELLVSSKTPEMAACQAHQIFGNPGGPNFRGLPRLRGTTLAVIKPHAVADGLTGQIIAAIQERGFCITAARLYRLSKLDAAEFLEVYKGVVHEYPEMLDHLASGPCVALELMAIDENASSSTQQLFRELVGPIDPEIARFLRPNTLRAQFGVNKVKNALHCTDLPDDAELEVNFFFRILDK